MADEKKSPPPTQDGWYVPESSNISRYRYDKEKRVLYVGFKTWVMKKNATDPEEKPKRVQSGDMVYSYSDVPETVFEELKLAESAGKFVSGQVVKAFEGQPRFERVILDQDKGQ